MKEKKYRIIIGLIIFLAFLLLSMGALGVTLTKPPSAASLSDETVETTDSLKVRQGPTTRARTVAVIPQGTRGTVTGGPQQADGFTWWQVDYATGDSGWSAGAFLTAVSMPKDMPKSTSTLVIDGREAGKATYTATVSGGTLKKNGELGSIDSGDRITTNSTDVEGKIGGGIDAYNYTGKLSSIRITSGDAQNVKVRVDGSPFEPEITIPTVSINAGPGVVTTGESATLNWSSNKVQSCIASTPESDPIDDWNGDQSENGSVTVSLDQNTTFTLTCEGNDGRRVTTSVTVFVDENKGNYMTHNGDGTYTLHTNIAGDVTMPAEPVLRVGPNAKYGSCYSAVRDLPPKGGIIEFAGSHTYKGCYGIKRDNLRVTLRGTGSERPTLTANTHHRSSHGIVVLEGIDFRGAGISASATPPPPLEGLFILNAVYDGAKQTRIQPGDLAWFEMHNVEIKNGGGGSLHHNLYAHNEMHGCWFENVYSHDSPGGHALKSVCRQLVVKDSYVTPIDKRRVQQFRQLRPCIAEHLSEGAGLGEGCQTLWNRKSRSEWQQLYSEWESVDNSLYDPLDAVACADSLIENTKVVNMRKGGGGKYNLQFRWRRTGMGGCDDPGYMHEAFYDPATWQLGDLTDPKNPNLKRHFLRDTTIEFVGPQAWKGVHLTNRGTQPVDINCCDWSGKGASDDLKPMPEEWKEKSRVFVAPSVQFLRNGRSVEPKVWGRTVKNELLGGTAEDLKMPTCEGPNDPCTARIYLDSNPSTWPTSLDKIFVKSSESRVTEKKEEIGGKKPHNHGKSASSSETKGGENKGLEKNGKKKISLSYRKGESNSKIQLVSPKVDFSASGKKIKRGQSITLTWQARGADRCIASGDWSGPLSLKGKVEISPSKDSSYRLECRNEVGDTQKVIKISVN